MLKSPNYSEKSSPIAMTFILTLFYTKALLLIGLSAVYMSASNCRRADNVIQKKVTLKSGDTLRYEMGYFGNEEGGYISQQSKHHQYSDIVDNAPTDFLKIYTYVPQKNYTGKDRVRLRSAQGSNGASPNTIEEIRVNINIEP